MKVDGMLESIDTSCDIKILEKVNAITKLPEDKSFIRKIQRLTAERHDVFKTKTLDWAMGEMLAYGSLPKVMMFGFLVRMLTGTFSIDGD